MGYNQGAYLGKGAFDDSATSSAKPYVEADKSSRTTAIFQGISGVLNSASDFYARLKYNAKPAYGSPNDPNVYYGGGFSWVPGQSGEPNKLQIAGIGGFAPILLLVVIVGMFFFLRK